MQRFVTYIWKKYGVLGMCFVVSIGVHVVGLVVFGSYKLFQYIYPRDGMFEAAPFRKKAVQLRSIQHKVMLKKPPKARVIRRLSVNKLAQVNLPVMPNKDALNRKFEVSKNFLDGGNIFSDYDVAENVFGRVKRMGNAFEGKIFQLPDGTDKLPESWPSKSLGSIYTSLLNIPQTRFDSGFPGVNNIFEFFGIEYNAKFYVKETGTYQWKLCSDDGSQLFLDGNLIMGIPRRTYFTETSLGKKQLREGVHDIRIKYFQNARYHVELRFFVLPPGGTNYVIFNLNDYPVPASEL